MLSSSFLHNSYVILIGNLETYLEKEDEEQADDLQSADATSTLCKAFLIVRFISKWRYKETQFIQIYNWTSIISRELNFWKFSFFRYAPKFAPVPSKGPI